MLVEESELPLPAGDGGGRYGTQKTGVQKDLRDAYTQLKALLRDMADNLGNDLAVARPHWPPEVQLEFGLCFSSSGNIWVLKASGEMTCTVYR